MDMVSEKVAKLCSVDEVDPTEPLSSCGLNSISVAELIAFLKQDMGYTRRQQMPMAPMKTDQEVPFRLETDNSCLIADLEFKTMRFPELGPDEVEVAVKGTALNFRDIMVGLGRLPLLSYERSALGRSIGIECYGEIAKIGSNVTRHKVGDKVVARQGGCVANRLRCHQWQAFELPSNLNWEQRASVISVYVTAYYALCFLANINENQPFWFILQWEELVRLLLPWPN